MLKIFFEKMLQKNLTFSIVSFYVVPAFTILSFHAIILDWFVLESVCGSYLAESIYEIRLRSIKQKQD